MGNLFADLPEPMTGEHFEVLIQTPTRSVKLERIVSTSHKTPVGDWYDQETNEWVLLLRGSAGLRFENQEEVLVMQPGAWVHIPAHRRHRVEWTDPAQPTIWLALHYKPAAPEPTGPAPARRRARLSAKPVGRRR